MPVVRPEYGPSLQELAAPRLNTLPRTTRRAVIAVAVLVVVALAAVVIHTTGSGLHDVLVRKPTAFTLGYRDGLRKVAPHPGEVLRLQPAPGADPQSFAISPLRIPPYSGDVTAAMMSIASAQMRQMAAADRTFAYRGEGKARINFFPAYQFAFQSRAHGKLEFGRVYLLANATDSNPSPRDGVMVELLSSYSPSVAPNIAAVGTTGLLKVPLRSFRFGTDRP